MITPEASVGRLKIDGIQFLRAIAAMMVVTLHAGFSVPGSHWLPSGGAGVDIFFIISGFIMAHTTRNVPGGLSDGTAFMWRRVLRIVPLYYLAILWTTRRHWPDLNLLKDFLFFPHYSNEIRGAILPIVQQGWTLNYEMLFYAIFAICLFFPHRLLSLTLSLAVLTATGSMFPGLYGTFYGNDIMLEFAMGVGLQQVASRGFPTWPRWVWVALMICGFAILTVTHDMRPRSLMVGVPALLIVWSSFRACDGWLRFRTLALLGEASYAIYLFHWASFGAVKPLARLVSTEWILMPAHLAVAAISGVLIHLWVEKPIARALAPFASRTVGERFARPSRSPKIFDDDAVRRAEP